MLTIQSKLLPFGCPKVMGILNATPDSFACHCSSLKAEDIRMDADTLLQEGADILDIGGCSTRPDAEPTDADTEWARLDSALSVIRSVHPDAVLSVDTFRAEIAERAIEQYRVDIINDVSGLEDPDMIHVLARTRVPYILTHPRSACSDWTPATNVGSELLSFFSYRLDQLHRAGVKDVILDPGLGFGKTVEQNYAILHQIQLLHHLNAPVLIGLSRKSMLCQPLGLTPQTALNATTAAHVLALINGADILRVHDVKEAQEAIRVVQLYQGS